MTEQTVARSRVWYRPMLARRADEEHRAATPLELFFDLCFVVAVSFAAARLHHSLTENHVADGVLGYLLVFFAIWWAWMNFTWFASAYDTDDGLYRLTTLVQMAGVLILAAGVPRAFDHREFTVVWIGYAVMRLAMVVQWLRAARADPPRRACALRYAAGIVLCQVGWVLLLVVPVGWRLVVFVVMALAELAVPVIAERAARTTWHPHHIAERYGLFTLIVLGECVLAATTAIQSALDTGHFGVPLLSLAGVGLVIVFAMWWLYFGQPVHHLLTTLRVSLVWGYGHLLVFSSIAAVGAGLEVAVDYDTHRTHLSALGAGYAVAVPVAVFVLCVWLLQVRPCPEVHGMLATVAFPVVAVLVLLTPFTPAPIHLIALVLAALVITVEVTRPRPRPEVVADSRRR